MKRSCQDLSLDVKGVNYEGIRAFSIYKKKNKKNKHTKTSLISIEIYIKPCKERYRRLSQDERVNAGMTKTLIHSINCSKFSFNRYTTLWRFRATRILALEIFDSKLSKSAHF